MLAFDALFPELAAEESRVINVLKPQDLPVGTFALQEAYCILPDCDCRRVMLNVLWYEREIQVATISYGFEPPKAPFEDEGQFFLDPLNPQTEYAPAFLAFVSRMIETDAASRASLRHVEARGGRPGPPRTRENRPLSHVGRHARHVPSHDPEARQREVTMSMR